MSLLKKSTAMGLAQGKNDSIRVLVNEMSNGLTIEKAMDSPKIFQLKRTIGEEMVVRLISAVLKAFADSVKAGSSIDAIDILEASEMIIENYSHESVKEIILALKKAKSKGENFYNSLTIFKINQILAEYLEQKSTFLERTASDIKSHTDGSVRTEAYTVSQEAQRRQDRQKEIYEMKELGAVMKEKADLEKVKIDINKALDGK